MNSSNQQRTLAMMTGFERYTKKTRRAMFLEEMEQVVPWAKLSALIEPHYPKAGNGRRPKELEKMLRIYFLQQWFNLVSRITLLVSETVYNARRPRPIDRSLGAHSGWPNSRNGAAELCLLECTTPIQYD